MLKRLHVQGFKSLRMAEVHLAPLVVLFGPNAAGKSNLLEAIVLLSRLVTERTLSEAFGPPLRGYPFEAFSLPPGGLPELLRTENVSLQLEADIEPRSDDATRAETLRYRVAVAGSPASGGFAVSDEHLVRLKRDGSTKHKPRIEQEGDHLVVRRSPEGGRPHFEPVGLNHTISSNLQFSGEDRYPDLDRLREEVSGWRSYYLDPAVAMRSPQPPREVNDIGAHGELLAPFLYRLQAAGESHFLPVTRALRVAIPSVESLIVELDDKRGTIDIRVRQDGTEYSARVLSEGTLRVLALCAIASNPWPGSLVAFEEPENGVHPRRIEVIADVLAKLARRGRQQVVVTTHSPTFLAAMLRKRRDDPETIKLLRCSREGETTVLTELPDPMPLFDAAAERELLNGPDDELAVQALLTRGWLDG